MAFGWNKVCTTAASLAKMTGNQQTTKSTTYEITGLVGSYQDSREFYFEQAMASSLSDESQEDLTEALDSPLLDAEEFERDDEEDEDFVVVDTADEWHWVDHWIKFLVD